MVLRYLLLAILALIYSSQLQAVVDRKPPVIGVPSKKVVEAKSPDGSKVKYKVTVTDNRDSSPEWSCVPASGKKFPLGRTKVVCKAKDRRGNIARESFYIKVVDRKGPKISVPEERAVATTAPEGRVVKYKKSAYDLVDGDSKVKCTPSSGSVFAVGKTIVNCRSEDKKGNVSKKSFPVRVDLESSDPNLVQSIAISWQAPTTRANGDNLPANEIAGYDIFVIAEGTGNDEVINVDSPSATSYIFKPQVADTYHFSIRSYDINGSNSELSDVISIVVD